MNFFAGPEVVGVVIKCFVDVDEIFVLVEKVRSKDVDVVSNSVVGISKSVFVSVVKGRLAVVEVSFEDVTKG